MVERLLESVLARFAEAWAAGDERMAEAWAEAAFTKAQALPSNGEVRDA